MKNFRLNALIIILRYRQKCQPTHSCAGQHRSVGLHCAGRFFLACRRAHNVSIAGVYRDPRRFVFAC